MPPCISPGWSFLLHCTDILSLLSCPDLDFHRCQALGCSWQLGREWAGENQYLNIFIRSAIDLSENTTHEHPHVLPHAILKSKMGSLMYKIRKSQGHFNRIEIYCYTLLYLAIMNNQSGSSSQRPAKKRRTVKGRNCIREGDNITADGVVGRTIIRQTESGLVEEVYSRHVWLNELTPEVAPKEPVPKITDVHEFNDNYNNQPDLQEEPDTTGPPKTQHYYLQEFVTRVHPLLDALLSREALPAETRCSHCQGRNMARWRCRDCCSPRMLCRGCMRVTHMDNPIHRIEAWTGTYFRPAALWQVGVYILVKHIASAPHCSILERETELLRGFQEAHDRDEQQSLGRGLFTFSVADNGNNRGDTSHDGPDVPNNVSCADDVVGDAMVEETLDGLYERQYSQGEHGTRPMTGARQYDEETMDEEIELTVPDNYMLPTGCRGTDTESLTCTDQAPTADVLQNPYIRVVHTNGIHHLALVFCRCRGDEHTHADLVAAGFLPTSFSRYRTIFTHHVLDDFRIANLECKASAYQYFQKLRRHTAPMDPESVPNLYHELRRMSRVWRWMKKLKWGGFGHSDMDHRNPAPGSLANFCAACPQPGINLPDNWLDDPQRYLTSLFNKYNPMSLLFQMGLPTIFRSGWKFQGRSRQAEKCRQRYMVI